MRELTRSFAVETRSGKRSKPENQSLEFEYAKLQPVWNKLLGEALFIVENSLESSGIKLHSVTHRIKSFVSFAAKVEREQTSNPFGEIRDIVGIRITCLFLLDMERICGLIRESFEVVEEDIEVANIEGKFNSFSYKSPRLTANIKDSSYGRPRYKETGRFPLEIQVRTVALDLPFDEFQLDSSETDALTMGMPEFDSNEKTSVPLIDGRVATEADVRSRIAVFCMRGSAPYSFGRSLPIMAEIANPDWGDDLPVGRRIMIVQAETDGHRVYLGAFDNAEGRMCFLEDVKLIE